MGLVRIRRIRHGVARHVMESRVRAYKKKRAKGDGRWVASEPAEHFCHSLTLKTSFFPLSIRQVRRIFLGYKLAVIGENEPYTLGCLLVTLTS